MTPEEIARKLTAAQRVGECRSVFHNICGRRTVDFQCRCERCRKGYILGLRVRAILEEQQV